MPVLRYFLFVGGALLALLLVCDAVFPQIPLPATLKSGSDLPAVRIQSERRWPERVVIDTSVPMTVLARTADPAQQIAGTTDVQTGAERDAFAQMNTSAPKPQTVASAKAADRSGAKGAPSSAAKVASAAPKPQPKRRIARARPPHPMMLVAQQPQPHFGFFGSTW